MDNKNNEMSAELLEKLKNKFSGENFSTGADYDGTEKTGDRPYDKTVEFSDLATDDGFSKVFDECKEQDTTGYDAAEFEPTDTANAVYGKSEDEGVDDTDSADAEDVIKNDSSHVAELNEEDIFAAWGLDPYKVKHDKDSQAEPSDNSADAVDHENREEVSNVDGTGYVSKGYRITRIERKEAYLLRKQTEKQQQRVDYDRTDYSLIKQALGMEKSTETYDDSNFEVDERSPISIPDSIDEPSEEFTYQRQRDDIVADYRKKRKVSAVKMVFSAVFAALLLVFECFSGILPEIFNIEYYPLVYSMATLQLLLISAAFCYREITNGALGILHGKINAGGTLAILVLVTVICDIINCVGGSATAIFNFSAALGALAVRIFDYMRIRREEISFEVASAPETANGKYVIMPVKGAEAAHICEGITEDSDEAKVLRTDKCMFVESYFARTENQRDGDFAINRYLVPIIMAVSVLAVIISVAKGASFFEASSLFNSAVAIGLPSIIFLGGSYPLYRASKKLYKSDSAIIGDNAPSEYADSSVICFDDADAFPSYGVTLETLRIYGKGDIETIIEQMGAVFKTVGGPLRHIFSLMTADCPRPYKIKVEGIYDDGLCATVDGKTLFIGSASYMELNGFVVTDKSDELGGKHYSTMYLAEEGSLRAKFYIKYSVDGGFEAMVRRNAKNGIASVILTGDSNINDELLSRCFDISKLPVKVVRRSVLDNSMAAKRADSGIVSRGGTADIVNAVNMCDRLVRVFGTLKGAKIASAVICAVLVIMLGVFGMTNAVSSLYTAVYQLFWILPCLIVARLQL